IDNQSQGQELTNTGNTASPVSALDSELGDRLLAQGLSREQVNFLMQRTPKEEVYTRPGKGGKSFTYIEIGYVIYVLNRVFGFKWDFEVVSKERLEGEVMVLGRLTVVAPAGGYIRKEQFGQSDIKTDRQGNTLSIADDYKAVASDALKKCASLLGIGSDVYGRDRSQYEEYLPSSDTQPVAPVTSEKRAFQGPLGKSTPRPAALPQPVDLTPENEMWQGFLHNVVGKLEGLGCAPNLITRLVDAITLNMQLRGTQHDRKALGVVWKAIDEWETSQAAVRMLNELTATNSRMRREAAASAAGGSDLFDEGTT
ncbi:MAG TPA: Rad52/Rad22 family DNA repair protein, partial [Candidatus Paceibacterota bacterium]